jgi:hypothetical protein
MVPGQVYRDTGATYFSESRQQSIPIADETRLNDFHLIAAFNKLRAQLLSGGSVFDADLDTFVALARELAYRDLSPAYKGGKAPDDWRLPVGDRLGTVANPAEE